MSEKSLMDKIIEMEDFMMKPPYNNYYLSYSINATKEKQDVCRIDLENTDSDKILSVVFGGEMEADNFICEDFSGIDGNGYEQINIIKIIAKAHDLFSSKP